jgi:hypothetical protein
MFLDFQFALLEVLVGEEQSRGGYIWSEQEHKCPLLRANV